MKEITTSAIAGDSFKPTEFEERPRISSEIRKHLIELIVEKILMHKKVIVFDKHSYNVTFNIRPNSDSVKPDRVLWSVRTIEGIQNIGISLYYKSVSQDMTPHEYTDALFDGLKTFLTEKYKKITPEEMEAVREQINWAYIDSLPFPAPFEDQQYILDANPNVEAAYRQRFGE